MSDRLPWEEWRLETARLLREAMARVDPESTSWDWTETMDWQTMREEHYDEGRSPAEAADEEWYAMQAMG